MRLHNFNFSLTDLDKVLENNFDEIKFFEKQSKIEKHPFPFNRTRTRMVLNQGFKVELPRA